MICGAIAPLLQMMRPGRFDDDCALIVNGSVFCYVIYVGNVVYNTDSISFAQILNITPNMCKFSKTNNKK